ncbi:class I SAM-dependent methyltransferase [Streptomyces sp. NA02950]|uniref:class I SAM-dependent methyltransferase n=1 Tax=Streptomyces sp. NA02950 TaxID=2742137 RepID=UPI00158FBF48|nr:class I SAM-dependent methyltransferase [Streptomyces sp. NA02950]QKV96318.1 class I SAM-dependent methyltransferase [Streptomyces sp. NA02950]
MTTKPRSDLVHAGQTIYRPWTLPVYDLVAFKINCRFLFRVPVSEVVALFDRNVSPDHLDVGVGTGYFLDNCRTAPGQAITLADLNEHSLEHAARRLARFEVKTVRANALEPLPLPKAAFGSASMNFLLHCVPGSIREKATVLDHVAACVRPGGRIFGATVLTQGVPVGAAARVNFRMWNRRGLMNNSEDSLADLRTELAARFPDHKVTVHGCTALFEAEVP